MSYGAEADRWNDAVASWFFNQNSAHQLVYLSVDDEELQRLASAAGVAPADARTAFIAAMREVSSPGDPFGYWRRKAREWERSPRPRLPPPFVALLALTALLADDATRRRHPGLYEPPAEALASSVEAVRRDYEDSVRIWWNALNQWLLDNNGSRGLPTAWAPTHGFRSIIGHAWSQVLVRRPDRLHFKQFFSSLGLQDGHEAALDPDRGPHELLLRWRTWVRRGGPASERLRRLVDDPAGPSSDEGRLLARILADELSHWDGAFEDEDRRPTLHLIVAADTFERRALYFAAVPRAGLAGVTLDFPNDSVRLGDELDLTEVPVVVTTQALANGVSLECSGVVVRTRHAPSYLWPVEAWTPGAPSRALLS